MSETQNEQPQPQEPQADWTPPTRDEFEQVVGAFWQAQARNEAMANYINAMGEQTAQPNQAQTPQPQDEDDLEELLLDTDKMRNLIAQEAERKVAETLNQHPMVKQAAEQRGAQIAQGVFDEIEKQIGPFDRAMAYHVAQSFAYSNPGVDPVQALYQGSQQARAYGEQQRLAAVEEYKAQLTNLATPQPGAQAGGPAAAPVRHVSTDYEQVADNFFARRNNPQLSPN